MYAGILASMSLVFSTLLLIHIFHFIALRIRNEHSEPRDPHLGRKFVLHMFLHFSIILLLSGLTISAIDVSDAILSPNQNVGGFGPGGVLDDDDFPRPGQGMQPMGRDWFNSTQRIALGLILSGMLHGAVMWAIVVLGTNSRKFPVVGRSFVISRLLISGIIMMTATTITIVFLLQKGSTNTRGLSVILGFALVWGPTGFIHFLWMMSTMRGREGKKNRQDNEPRRSKSEDDYE